MYQAYWQLQCKPFEPGCDDGFYYPGESHQGALLKMRYALDNHRDAAVLAGPSGSGKTMLIAHLRRQLPESFSPFAHIVFPKMSDRELLAYLADELAGPGSAPARGGRDESVRRMQNFLADNARQGRHAVIVLDEAHLLEECGTLETIRLLINFQQPREAALTILLTGQPAILPILARWRDLDERLAVKALLRAFNLEETISYINHRLTAAHATRTIFNADAMEAVHHQTQGNARQINRLCDLALLVGFAESHETITADHIDAVAEELLPTAAVA